MCVCVCVCVRACVHNCITLNLINPYTVILSLSLSHRSMALYYGGGITIGVLASVLILLYIFSKFVPKVNKVFVATGFHYTIILPFNSNKYIEQSLNMGRDPVRYVCVCVCRGGGAVLYCMKSWCCKLYPY